jgi:hypothetical protein
MREVDKVIAVGAETRSAIVAALNDMDRYAGQDQAQGSRHRHYNDYLRRALTGSGSDPELGCEIGL